MALQAKPWLAVLMLLCVSAASVSMADAGARADAQNYPDGPHGYAPHGYGNAGPYYPGPKGPGPWYGSTGPAGPTGPTGPAGGSCSSAPVPAYGDTYYINTGDEDLYFSPYATCDAGQASVGGNCPVYCSFEDNYGGTTRAYLSEFYFYNRVTKLLVGPDAAATTPSTYPGVSCRFNLPFSLYQYYLNGNSYNVNCFVSAVAYCCDGTSTPLGQRSRHAPHLPARKKLGSKAQKIKNSKPGKNANRNGKRKVQKRSGRGKGSGKKP